MGYDLAAMNNESLSPGDAYEAALRADKPIAEPFAVLEAWLESAWEERAVPNPNAMALATVGASGPSARIVLCKALSVADGYVVFYTNYESRKARELLTEQSAAAVFHFDHAGRQVRLEGAVVLSPATESDAYFSSRHRASQIGAWASDQSQPIDNRDALAQQLKQRRADLDADTEIERPAHWGGFRLWAQAVELWCDGDARLHDRYRYERELKPDGEHWVAGPWSARRLQP